MSHTPESDPSPRPGTGPSRGQVRALWIKRARLGPMDPAARVTLVAGRGIAGNANQGGWRQVTVIEEEVFEGLREELGDALDPAMRRANVMVRGVRLAGARGKILHLGSCRIHLRGETLPCERMDQALPGLQAALRGGWRGGVFGRVLDDGEIWVGDPAWLEDAAG